MRHLRIHHLTLACVLFITAVLDVAAQFSLPALQFRTVTATGKPYYVRPHATDLDQDGATDLLVAGQSGELIWFRNLGDLDGDGDPEFSPSTQLEQGIPFTASAHTDLDGDGVSDMVFGGYPSLLWARGRPAGNSPVLFDPAAVITAIGTLTDLEGCDLDQNGLTDLVANSARTLLVLQNLGDTDGDGIPDFTQTDFLSSSGLQQFNDAVCLDLDGDGDPDILAGEDGGFMVLWNTGDTDGDGIIDLVPVAHAGENVLHLATGDLDRNGSTEIAAATGVGNILQLQPVADTDGDGFMDFSTTTLGGNLGSLKALAVDDADANGWNDIAFLGNGQLGFLMGQGDTNADGQVDFTPETPLPLAIDATGLAAHDLNGDGRKDWLLPYPSGMRLYLNNGGPANLQTGWVRNFIREQYDLQQYNTADFNQDGLADIYSVDAVGSGKLLLAVQRNTPPLHSPPFAEKPNFTVDDFPNLAHADFNRDGRMDLAVLDYTAATARFKLGWLRNTGDSNLDGQPDFQRLQITTFDAGSGFSLLLTVDLNRDDRMDLLAADMANGEIRWYQNIADINGDGQPDFFPRTLYTGLGPLTGLTTGDLNGDGNTDLLLQQDTAPAPDPQPLWLRNEGDTNLDGTPEFSTHSTPLAPNARLLLSDVDNDGADELLVFSYGNNSYSWYRPIGDINGDGQEEFSATPLLLTGNRTLDGLVISTLYDLDGNGLVDLLLYDNPSGGSGIRTWHIARHVGMVDDRPRFKLEPLPVPGAFLRQAGDLDGNGIADFLAARGPGYAAYVQLVYTRLDSDWIFASGLE